jgi:hypothetical protein
MSDDERLLRELAQALVPGPLEPSEEEILALRRAVSRRFGGRPAPRPFWALPWGTSSLAGRRPVAMVLVAAALAAGGALVLRGGASGPARTAAHAEALPADSPELVETRAAMASVHSALAAHDKAGVAQSSAELRRHLEHLDEGDLRAVGGEGPALLIEAEAFVLSVVVDEEGPPRITLTMRPRTRPAPESACEEPPDEDEEQAVRPPRGPVDDDVEEDEEAEGREQQRRDADRARRDAERVQRDAERAQRDAERAQRDAERHRREIERARESIAREAERARRDALKEAAKARGAAMREAEKEAAKARGAAMREAEKAREAAMREAEKEIAKARREIEKQRIDIRRGPTRIEIRGDGHVGPTP